MSIKTSYPNLAAAKAHLEQQAFEYSRMATTARLKRDQRRYHGTAEGLKQALRILDKIENENAEAIELLSILRNDLSAGHQELPGVIRSIEVLKYN